MPSEPSEKKNDAAVLENILNELNKIQQQNNNIVTQNNEVKKELAELKTNFDALTNDLNECKTEISKLKRSSEFLTEQYESHKKQQDNILKENVKLNNVIDPLKVQNKALEKSLNKETVARNRIENNNRKINVEISGIPVIDGENSREIVCKIGTAIGIEVPPNSIDKAHRHFSKTPTAIPPINVRLKSRTERDHFFYNRKLLKSITIH